MAARVQQKERTRTAILDAARELVRAGGEVTMPLVAASARVSEATAYRYFPDLASLLAEARLLGVVSPGAGAHPLGSALQDPRGVGRLRERGPGWPTRASVESLSLNQLTKPQHPYLTTPIHSVWCLPLLVRMTTRSTCSASL